MGDNKVYSIIKNIPNYSISLQLGLMLSFVWIFFSKSKSVRYNKKKFSIEEQNEMISNFEPEELVPDTPEDHPNLKSKMILSKIDKRINVDGFDCLNLATHNYLGFLNDNEIEKEADVHLESEELLAKLMNMEDAIVYSSGHSESKIGTESKDIISHINKTKHKKNEAQTKGIKFEKNSVEDKQSESGKSDAAEWQVVRNEKRDRYRTNFRRKKFKNIEGAIVYSCDHSESKVGTESKDIISHNYKTKHKKNEAQTKGIKFEKNSVEYEQSESEKSNATELQVRNEKRDHDRTNSRRQNRCMDSRKLFKKVKTFLKNYREIEEFLNDSVVLGEKLEFIPDYEKIEESILKSLGDIYPDIQLNFFGSRISGLGNLDSDLDIFLEIGNVFNLYNVPQKDVEKKLRAVTKSLKLNNEWDNYRVIVHAKVPILRVHNTTHNIDCDISFSNGLGTMNTSLTKHIFVLQPICHKMCLFIKKWLQITTLKLQFSTYTFVMMAIFFLQTKNVLPTIKQLQDDIKKPFEIGPWHGDFNVGKKLKDFQIELVDPNNKNCMKYLIEFFNYYKQLDFGEFVISPYCGKLISKQQFNSTAINEFPRYADYYKKNPKDNTIQLSTPMIVQDPFELNHNIANRISDVILDLMKEYCQETANCLSLNSKRYT